MSGLARPARFLAAALLGVFTGAMLTEGMFLVPWWRSLPARDFLVWYAVNDRRLFGYFGTLTEVTALVAIAAALLSFWEGHASRRHAALAATLCLVAVATFFIYFRAVNASFAAATIPVDAVPAELRRWATWHWGRIGLSFAALAASLLALRARP